LYGTLEVESANTRNKWTEQRHFKQCCGSGPWILDPVPFWPLDPGSGYLC